MEPTLACDQCINMRGITLKSKTKTTYIGFKCAPEQKEQIISKCRKYGLSVIQTNQGKAMHYAQWKAEAEGKPTWRTAIRMDIQEAIGVSFSWSQFVKEMEKRGYAWKLNRKYPSLKTPGMERYIRLRSLGKGYGEAEIREKILRPKIRQVYGNTQMQSPRRKLTGLQRLYYSYLYQMGGISKEAQADSLCSTFRYPEAGPKDLPNGISTKGRDHNQGRTGSIPEALGKNRYFSLMKERREFIPGKHQAVCAFRQSMGN